MEAYEEKTHDFADYNGSLMQKGLPMEDITKYIELLVQAIKESSEYRQYKEAEAVLDQNPQLKSRVDEFNRENFRIHTQNDPQQLFQGINALDKESQALRNIPQVNAYIQAELDLCKLLQYVSLEINGEIDIHVPGSSLL